MTLAEFFGLQAMMDLDASMADAVGRIVALVPATAVRIGVTVEDVWRLPADEAMQALAETVPVLMTDENATAMLGVAEAMKHAFSVSALLQASGSAETVSAEQINAALAAAGEKPLPHADAD